MALRKQATGGRLTGLPVVVHRGKRMKTLLLEIGTEEIPAGYIDPALAAIASMLAQKLGDARIAHGRIATCGTPRRLSAMVEDLDARQKPLTREILGPPKSAAFDADGRPTVAAVKFAEKVGLPVERLGVASGPKGDYLSAVVKEAGGATRTLLKTILPEVILATPFPKSMRWAGFSISFARPIQSILALYGSSAIGFELESVRSGRVSFGHRFMHPAKLRIAEPAQYAETLRKAFVIVDIAERRRMIAAAVEQAAAEVGGRVLKDEELLDINTHLVEYPAVSVGRFSEGFLELPPEVLITAMREHQKYFAVADAAGALLPHFIAVNNTPARDMAVLTTGHERVLRARLEDARFFYRVDKEIALDQRVEKLKNVLFQAQLGSIHDKTVRIESLGRFIVERVGGDDTLGRHVERAAHLCKADLVSHMVGEFPKLQGVMGRVYAGLQAEAPEVAAAIEEHYRPVHSGAALPATMVGAIVAIADKMDTICGCFRAGLIPSGAADPYALRRAGIGVIQIMRRRGFRFAFPELVERGVALYPADAGAPADTVAKITAFLEQRMASILAEEGFARDTVAAVLGVAVDSVPGVWQRAQALEQLKRKPDFEPIAVSFKRVVNIIRKAEGFAAQAVDENLFAHPSESGLLAAFREVDALVQADLRRGLIDQALARVASLRQPVDVFFDDVMVMAEDMRVRRNRLSLLALVAGLFDTFADFSKLSA
jgi:glycyl-tRNA synthetase beta chain